MKMNSTPRAGYDLLLRDSVNLNYITFPGGEVHINAVDIDAERATRFTLTSNITSSDDIMELLMVTDAIRRQSGQTPIHLVMPYVPYARQDRVCNPGEALGIKVFCDLINAQNYASVTILDPHSDVTGALLDRVHIIDQTATVGQVLALPEFANGVTLVSPDAGASKKVLKLAKAYGIKDVVFADKVRDTKTGEITSIEVRGFIPDSQPLLVVDDICDGGRTFIELAKALELEAPLNPFYLYVTHGIFSKGTDTLLDRYMKIYTTRDWTNQKHPRVHLITPKGL